LVKRHAYLLKWTTNSLDAVWLGGVSRPKALLRALAPQDCELTLHLAKDERTPQFKV
jgi:hypothetical protein